MIDPEAEIEKYERLYLEDPTYRMGASRKEVVRRLLQEAPRGTLLDVGTGRAEAVRMALDLGFEDAVGTDAARVVCDDDDDVFCCMAWEQPFPDRAFGTVTCWDVLEHLPSDHIADTIMEIARVCGHRLLISAASKPDIRDGVDLHISAQSRDAWDDTIRLLLGGEFEVRWRKDAPTGTSDVWECVRIRG